MGKTGNATSKNKVKYYGLINQGSTCYLNSVLQVLFMTKDFREAVKRENEENTEFMNHRLQELFKNLEKCKSRTDAVTVKLGIDRVYEQQDAAVYYEKILRLTSPEASQIFNGKLAYRTTCVQCNTRTERDWPFWHLPLALVDPGSKSYSVEDGIKEYFKASHLNEENQLYCDKCDDKTDAETIPVIKHHPEVLMLLLKRFKYDILYKSYVKINCSVDVPYSLQIPESQTYELYAVVDHFGDLRSGHYTATIKGEIDNENKWYNFDDSWVSPPFQVDNTERSQSAYLLFYRKKKNADTPDSQEVSHAGGVKLTTKNHNEMTDVQRNTMDIKTKDKTCRIKPLTQNFNRDTEQQDNGGLGTVRGNRNDDKLKMRPRVYATKGNEKAKRDVKYYGLINQGSTCYLNSVLQVLFMTKDFREAVKREIKENTEFMACLQKLFKNLEKRTAHTDAVRRNLGIDRVYEQQDAAVYYEKILRLTSPEASQIFNGKLAYRTTCVQCNTRTERDSPFWHLPLVLVDSGSKSYNVEDGIKEYFKASHLNEENQLYCDNCDDKTDAVTIPVMKHHPQVLMLLLKRFTYDIRYKSYVKINCSVDVPYSLQIPESQTYELYAVVDHFGGLRSGHYTATIKDKNDNEDKWYNFNDSQVSPLSYQPFQVDTTERSHSAYLLFYRKKNTDTRDSQEVSHTGGVKLTTRNNNDQGQDAEKIRDRYEDEDAAEDGNDTAASVSTDRLKVNQDFKTNNNDRLAAHGHLKDKMCAIKPLTQNCNKDTEQQDNGGLGTSRWNRNQDTDDKLNTGPHVSVTKGNEKAKRDGESKRKTGTKVGAVGEKFCNPAKDHKNRGVDIKHDMRKDGQECQQGKSKVSNRIINKQQREKEKDGSEDNEQKRRNDEHARREKSKVKYDHDEVVREQQKGRSSQYITNSQSVSVKYAENKEDTEIKKYSTKDKKHSGNDGRSHERQIDGRKKQQAKESKEKKKGNSHKKNQRLVDGELDGKHILHSVKECNVRGDSVKRCSSHKGSPKTNKTVLFISCCVVILFCIVCVRNTLEVIGGKGPVLTPDWLQHRATSAVMKYNWRENLIKVKISAI